MRCAESLQSLNEHLFFLGAPPRRGSVTCRVAFGGIESDERESEELADVVRCLPAWTRRRVEVGAEVRRERRWRSVVIGVADGIVRGIAGSS